MTNLKIGSRVVGGDNPCFIIAEVSCNHMGEYEKAVDIVKEAAGAGADAVKLQTYSADTMTIDAPQKWFKVGGEDNPESWKGLTYYKLYQEAMTPWDWQPKLKTLANSLGIELFSTPFDATAVDFLEKEINPPCYKIASYELTDDTLLEAVAKTGSPVIISNGYATFEELKHALEVLRNNGVKEIVVLYCVTEYETKPTSKNVNLSTMQDISDKFAVTVGLSDNNGGIDLPVLSVPYGAKVIEKHLILHKDDSSHDQRFSVTPEELADLVARVRSVEAMSETEKRAEIKKLDPQGDWWGNPHYGPTSKLEHNNITLRRSLFVVKDVEAGEEITRDNVRSIRPQVGLAPRHYHEVMGKHYKVAAERGTPLAWDLVE